MFGENQGLLETSVRGGYTGSFDCVILGEAQTSYLDLW